MSQAFFLDFLERDPLLIFGEGEYGVTDVLYAASRTKDIEVFRLVFGLRRIAEVLHGKGRGARGACGRHPCSFPVGGAGTLRS
ncbi:hypothetical protein MLD38_022714 [Melastoma candidum]|uniref:Uncharacterized protein n=1 Tax=Melastoma candidum TaxID=119954 RepID=A0ACB9QM11_9MYRT|nr:hypothetical protein MLD38_022714 [Melastoma candidum]